MGFFFGVCSDCCKPCDCTCESSFGIFLNGRTLFANFGTATYGGTGYQFIPGLTLPCNYLERLISNAVVFPQDAGCDDDGNLVVRVSVGLDIIYTSQSEIPSSLNALIAETRQYKFDLSNCANNLITGEDIGDATYELTTSGEAGVDFNASDFQIQWDELSVQAWCNKSCPNVLTEGCDQFDPLCGSEDLPYCECEQPLDQFGVPLQGFDPITSTAFDLFLCRLRNPLP